MSKFFVRVAMIVAATSLVCSAAIAQDGIAAKAGADALK